MAQMQYLIKRVKPDLVVFSGDQASDFGDMCLQNELYCEISVKNIANLVFSQGWSRYTFPLRLLNQPYALILGNHD